MVGKRKGTKISNSDFTVISLYLNVHPVVLCFFTQVHVHTEHLPLLVPLVKSPGAERLLESSRDLSKPEPPSHLKPLMPGPQGSFPPQRPSDPEADGFQTVDYKDSSLVGSEAKRVSPRKPWS